MDSTQSPPPAQRRPALVRHGTEVLGQARGPLACSALAVGVAWFLHRSYWHFLCDDAYISFRYARNLARYGELAFNVSPLERVEGYTNFLWVMLLALGDSLGVAPELLAPLLCAGASLWILWLSALLSSQLRSQRVAPPLQAVSGDGRGQAAHGDHDHEAARAAAPSQSARVRRPVAQILTPLAVLRARVQGLSWLDLLAPALLCAWPEFIVWGSGGLEGALAVALGLRAWLAVREDRWPQAGTLAAASILTRPDSITWLLPLLVLDALASRRPLSLRKLVIMLLAMSLPVVLHLTWRRLYYDAWVPNTWTVKQHGALLRSTVGVAYVVAWGRGVLLPMAAPLLLVAARSQLALALALIVAIAYPWSVGGDFMAYGRLMLPATVLLAILSGSIGARLVQERGGAEERSEAKTLGFLASRQAAARGLGVALLIVWILVSAARIPLRITDDRDHPWLDGRFETVTAMDRFARIRVAAGHQLKRLVPPETLVSVGAAGALPYASGVQILDTLGLTDREVALRSTPHKGDNARPGHQLQIPASLLRARDPDLLCHAGTVGPQPSQGSARKYGPYQWACIEVGLIEDPRSMTGSFDAGHYCCLRPQSRSVGSFSAAAIRPDGASTPKSERRSGQTSGGVP